MNKALLAIASVAVLAGCGTTIRYMPTNAPPRQLMRRPAYTVQLFTAAPPTAPYMEIGLIEAQQQSQLSVDPPEVVMQKLREKAADVGCDGLLVRSENAVVGSSGQYGGSTSTLRGYAGTCIVFTGYQSYPGPQYPPSQPWGPQPYPAQPYDPAQQYPAPQYPAQPPPPQQYPQTAQ